MSGFDPHPEEYEHEVSEMRNAGMGDFYKLAHGQMDGDPDDIVAEAFEIYVGAFGLAPGASGLDPTRAASLADLRAEALSAAALPEAERGPALAALHDRWLAFDSAVG